VRSFFKEYRDFINKGDVITIAIGLTMALYFQQIINAFIEGIINPIIATIVGESDYREWGIDIGDAELKIGLVLDAIITFCIVAFLLFLIIKLYNRMRAEPDATPSIAPEIALLTEIRDELRSGRPEV
jgi:large conductance mechanosensitive channel